MRRAEQPLLKQAIQNSYQKKVDSLHNIHGYNLWSNGKVTHSPIPRSQKMTFTELLEEDEKKVSVIPANP